MAKKEKSIKGRSVFRKIRRGILFSILALLIGICAIPGGKESFRIFVTQLLPSPSPYEVSLSGTPEEIGAQQGKYFKYSMRLLEKIYVEKIISGGSEKKLKDNTQRAKEIFYCIDERWTREVDAMAKASGCKAENLMLGNTFLDMGIREAGCRLAIVPNGKSLLHSHNLDWDNLGGVGNFLVTIFRTEAGNGRYATVRLAFPGMIGGLDIINEKGIALSFNQAGFSSGKSKMPVFIKMREIAETCSTFEEAEKEILSTPEGMPFCIGLSNSRNGKAAVFERDLSMEIKKRIPVNDIITADNNLWCGSKMSSCMIEKIAQDIKPHDLESLKKVLRDKKVLMACNIYSVIFDYPNNAFYLASGRVPAALGEYKKFPLFIQILNNPNE